MKNPEVISEEKVEKRKEKIKNWLGDDHNLTLICILIFSFIILIYYFNLTKNQPLWWDEAEYMATAKHWAFDVPYEINSQRPILFPFLAFILYKLSFGELWIKFLLELMPFLLSILFTYLLVIEMYNNKKLALISSFILSVSWIHIFYTMRFMTDSLSFMFGVLAFYSFWKGYINGKGKRYIWLIGFFVALSFLSKLTGILFGVFILLFLIFTDKFNFIKNKHLWISLLISFLTILPYLVWSYFYYGNPFAFRSGYGAYTLNNPLGWWMIRFVYDYPEFIFFIFFLVGILTLLPMFLSLDRIILKRDKKFYNDFFIVLNILFTLGFFIYFLRQVENRWLIMMSIGIFVLSAKGIILVYDISKKNIGKILAVLIIVSILVFGTYYELNHASNIINLKKDTYIQVKEAALWIKENTNSSDSIYTASLTQTTYHAERRVISMYNNSASKYFSQEEFERILAKEKPKYYVVSIFESWVPRWGIDLPQNKSNFIPVNAWFADAAKTQPVLVIYEIKYST